jgi:signal transduction histidine kinase
MAVIAAGLLGLIVLLATLQYQWLGKISGAERERMKATLGARATAYAQDVDRELTRAYLLFQLEAIQALPGGFAPPDPAARSLAGTPDAPRRSRDSLAPLVSKHGIAATVAARYDRWQATARFPRMVKDVYLVSPPAQDAAASAPPLQRYNPSTRFIEPADWPAPAADIGKLLSQTAPATGTSLLVRTMVPAVWADVPALVIPAPMLMVSHIDARIAEAHGTPARLTPTVRHTIVLLDADYMKKEMLPALAQQHFQGTGDGFDYQLAVVRAEAGKDPLYRSVGDYAPAPDAKADANVELFQVRIKDFEPLAVEVNRFAALSALPRVTGKQTQTHTIFREAAVPRRRGDVTSADRAAVSIIVQGTPTPGVQQRIDKMIAGASATTFSTRLNVASPAHWRLVVKHPSGSLEQAVDAARRRNLAISTTIFAILGLSVGFLVLSTRRAQDLARQQLEFVATVSHELRTPLAVIRSAADNLADGVVGDDERVRQYGQLVRREGLRLTDLVEQILEFAGLQSGQRTIAVRPVEIGTLLRDVAATAEATAPAGITIDLSIPDDLPAVAGDESALRRVFQNLVGNAIKYGADARWIQIKATAGGATLDVSVTDRGIGIAAADQARIFDPFYRAPDVVAAQIQGAGLGLSLVKRIVEAHAGRIALKSAPGAGSTFTVTLPVLHGDVAEGPDRVSDPAPQTS